MDIFHDFEVVFTDAYATKPSRTLFVNTNAPLHSINSNVAPSSGVSTFPPDSAFRDRFIVWRAIGQKLFLEEKSVCRTVLRGSFCLEFARTPILPGTSICLLKNSILSIVVPTQSSVHRFYARLVPDNLDDLCTEVSSIFEQIVDKEFLVDFHTSYLLTTNGQATRAAVMHQSEGTKIAYCMAEGQLVIVNMPLLRGECEEVVYREGSLLSRIMSGSSSLEGVCDVCVLDNDSSDDMFYAVYRDGVVRAWNTEHQKSHYISLDAIPNHLDINSVLSLSIRAYNINSMTLVIVATSSELACRIHVLRDVNRKLSHVQSFPISSSGNLLDIAISSRNGGQRLWLLWNSLSVMKDYKLQYVEAKFTETECELFELQSVYPLSSNQSSNMEMSKGELFDSVFNADNHPFEVVHRAVQISCDPYRFEPINEDWSALLNVITLYLRTPEFDEKYMERGRSIRAPAKEARDAAEKRLYYRLALACEELEQASRGPLGLFLVDMPGACLGGVIQQDLFSVIHDGDKELMLTETATDVTMLEECLKSAEDAKRRSLLCKEDNGDCEIEDEADWSINEIGRHLIKEWLQLVEAFLRLCSLDAEGGECVKNRPSFGGRFTSGFIAASLRKTIEIRISFAHKLADVLDWFVGITRCTFSTEVSRSGLRTELTDLHFIYQQMLYKLDTKVHWNGAYISLCSLFMAENGYLDMWYYNPSVWPLQSVYFPEFNLFVKKTVQVALKNFLPTAHSTVLFDFLSKHAKYNALKRLCNTRTFKTPTDVFPVMQFYLGIALSGLGKPQQAIVAFKEASRFISKTKVNLSLCNAVCPNRSGEPVTLGEYYSTAIRYLKDHGHSEEVHQLANEVIQLLPANDPSTSSIYATLFNHLVNHGKWEEALLSIVDNKDLKMRRDSLRELMTRLLQNKDWKRIVEFCYGDLEEQVETILFASARAQDICISPHLFELAYSFYMYHFNFAKAAHIMYEQAVLLKEATQTPELLKRRRDCLAATSTLLDLLPPEERFLRFINELSSSETPAVVPDVLSQSSPSSDRELETKSFHKKPRMVIVDAQQVCVEWSLANARIALLSVNGSRVPPTDPAAIVADLIDILYFDLAFDVCRQCNVPVYDLMCAVTRESCMLDCQEALTPSWLNWNKRHILASEVGDEWAVVRGLLRACQTYFPTDSRPFIAVTTTILSHGINVPLWLTAQFADFDLSQYVRCLLDFDVCASAFDPLLDGIREELDKVRSSNSKVLLPYSVIDELLVLSDSSEDKKFVRLKESLSAYHSRIASFETAAKFSM